MSRPTIEELKERAKKRTKSTATIDLTLALRGNVEPDETYLARVISARFIHLEERTPKIDLTLEVLNRNEERIGILDDTLFLSSKAMKAKNAEAFFTEEELQNNAVDPYELCKGLPGRPCGVLTRESLRRDGETEVIVSRYVGADEIEIETEAD